mgnify:CR=1 FL=1
MLRAARAARAAAAAALGRRRFTTDRAYAPLACGAPDEPLLKELVLALTAGGGGHCAEWVAREHGGSMASAAKNMRFTPVLGGITNQLFRVDFVALAAPARPRGAEGSGGGGGCAEKEEKGEEEEEEEERRRAALRYSNVNRPLLLYE